MPELPPPNLLDIAALVAVCIGAIQGVFRGLSGELSRFISTIVSFIVGMVLYRPFGSWLATHTRLGEAGSAALAFFLTIAAAVVVMVLLRTILKQIFKLAVNPGVDRIGGIFAGMLRASLFVVAIFWLMNLWPHEYLNRKFGRESVVGTLVRAIMPDTAADNGSNDSKEPDEPI